MKSGTQAIQHRAVAGSAWRTALVLVAAAALLALPAAVNGFPFIFYDSTGYMKRATAVTHGWQLGRSPVVAQVAPHNPASTRMQDTPQGNWSPYQRISRNPFFVRPITYSIFLLPFSTALTIFLLPFGQGLLAAYAILRLLRVFSIRSARTYLAVVLGVVLLSSLPIHVGYVMPDVMSGILVVMIFSAVYSWPRNSITTRVADILLIAGLIACHLSFIPLTLALLVAGGLGAWLFRRQVGFQAVAGAVALPLVMAAGFLVGSNFVVSGKAVLSESSSIFLVAQLVGDGPARQYLRESCPQKRYLLCDQLPKLTDRGQSPAIADYFLWDPHGAVKEIGDPRLIPEAAEINKETIRRYPLEVAADFIRKGLQQLVQVQVDEDLLQPPQSFIDEVLARISAGDTKAYLASAQGRGGIPLGLLRAQVTVGLLASLLAFSAVAIWWRRRISKPEWCFVAFALVAVAANAFATGGLAGPHDRYGNRIAWLVPMAALVLVVGALARRQVLPDRESRFDLES